MSNQIKVPNYVTIVKIDETTDDGYCYVAYHPELPNIVSQGDTPDEARENLVEATELAINHLILSGLPIPEPQNTMFSTSVASSEYAQNDLVVTNSITMPDLVTFQ